MKSENYPSIDLVQTGKRIKRLIESAGYTPKMIQDYLHLSCVQPIYRWYKGQILPSVDHLLALSELLGVHMENLLVKKSAKIYVYEIEMKLAQRERKYLMEYYQRLCALVRILGCHQHY